MKLSTNQKIFTYITTAPNYIKTANITILYRFCDNRSLGFIVPRFLGSACKRNRFKRRCRYAFQKINFETNLSSVGVIVKTKSINVTYNQINNIFASLSSEMLEN